MTPTEQDKKLRELQEFIKSCFGMEPKEDWYDSYRYSDRVRIRDFITADRKRVALEAELKVWMRLKAGDGLSTHDGCFEIHPDYINEQIAQLKAQQEEV